MRAAVRIKPGFEKQARGRDYSQDAENQRHSGGFREVSHVSQIMRFLAKRLDDDLPEAFKVSEGQLDLALLRPRVRRRNGSIGHVRQRQNGSASQKHCGGGDPSDNDDEQN